MSPMKRNVTLYLTTISVILKMGVSFDNEDDEFYGFEDELDFNGNCFTEL